MPAGCTGEVRRGSDQLAWGNPEELQDSLLPSPLHTAAGTHPGNKIGTKLSRV